MLANRVRMGRGIAAAALSVGALRRRAAVSAQQYEAGGEEFGSQGFLLVRRHAAAALSEEAGLAAPPPNSGRVPGSRGDADAGAAEARRGGRREVRSRVLALARLRQGGSRRRPTGFMRSICEGRALRTRNTSPCRIFCSAISLRNADGSGWRCISTPWPGAGSYFEVEGANPLRLESVLNDPDLRKTTFVMVHGGWPFTREITAATGKAECLSGLFGAIAAAAAGDSGQDAARVAGVGPGEGDVRNRRLSVQR